MEARLLSGKLNFDVISFRISTRSHTKVKSGSLTKAKVLDTRSRVPASQDSFAYLNIPLSSSQSLASIPQHISSDLTGVPCVATLSEHYSADLSQTWITAVKTCFVAGTFSYWQTGQKARQEDFERGKESSGSTGQL